MQGPGKIGNINVSEKGNCPGIQIIMERDNPIKNVISIDLEDWFCVSNLKEVIQFEDWGRQESRIERNTHRIFKLLDTHNIRATFFVLGWIAERFPSLVKDIHSQGHEIATHGYSHQLITGMTPKSFEEDLQRAIDITENITGEKIKGFRAPSFTITPDTLWAIDVLIEAGLKYDSSVFPVSGHPDYGMPDSPLGIHEIKDGFIEVPLTVAKFATKNIPVSGGGYFRLFPYGFTRNLMKRVNHEGRSVIFYFHPWEIDPEQPRVKLPLIKRFRHYNNLNKTYNRLDRLLTDFNFTTMRDVIGL